MTIDISDNDPRISYTANANGAQTVFAVPFEFFDNTDLKVYVAGVLKSEGTGSANYGVSGGAGSTGTVTFVSGVTASATVVITRSITIERVTDFTAGADINRAALNTQLDTLTAIAADLKDTAGRALQLTDFDAAASLVLPAVDDRKGKVLAFNETSGAVEAGPSTSAVQTVADNATAVNLIGTADAISDINDLATTTNINNISSVAGIASNVSTVAGIASNVTSVANDATDIAAVAGKATEIGLLGNSTTISNMNLLGTSDAVSDMNTLGTSTNVTNQNTLAGIASNITTVAGISSDVTAVAADATDIGAVAGKATEIGRLGTSDAVADMAILGTSDVVADMNTLGTAAVVEDMNLLGTSANVTAMGLLGTSDVVADMALLGTSAVVADMAILGTTDVVADMAILGTSDVVADMNTLATSDIVTDMNLLATSSNVAAMAQLGTSDVVADMALLGTSDVVADLAILGTSDAVADMNTLATSDIVSDMNTLATSANVTAMGLLGTSAVVEDMGFLGTAAVVEDMGILGTSANVTAMSNVSGSIGNVNTVATNLSGITAFSEVYSSGGTDPTSNLNAGDLFFNTSSDALKVYDGSNWVAGVTAGSGFLPLAGGTMTGNLIAGDNVKAVFGAGSDLEIFHDGSHSIVKDSGTGNLKLLAENFSVQDPNQTEQMILATPNGSVNLYHNGNKKIETSATGIAVTGNVIATGTVEPAGDTAAGDNAAIGYTAAEGLILTGQGSTSDITLKNDADATVFTVPTGTDDILFPDDAKAMFGAGSDLQIYHDANHSNIRENGNGNLQIWGNNIVFYNSSGDEIHAQFTTDGAVELRYNNGIKLTTTSTGVDVTGNIVVSGTVDGVDLQTLNTAVTANTAKTTNATHSGEVTGSGALTIADNVVDEANLKVSNSPVNGYMLTAQSGNTGGLTWAEAGGGGLHELIATSGAISNAASVVFANQFDSSKYDHYLFILTNVMPVTSSRSLYCHTSTDAGSSYATTYGDYHRDNNADQYGLVVASGVSNTSPSGCSGRFELYSPLDSSTNTHALTLVGKNGADSPQSNPDAGYLFSGRNADEVNNAVRFSFFAPNSNIASGEIAMYGIKKA